MHIKIETRIGNLLLWMNSSCLAACMQKLRVASAFGGMHVFILMLSYASKKLRITLALNHTPDCVLSLELRNLYLSVASISWLISMFCASLLQRNEEWGMRIESCIGLCWPARCAHFNNGVYAFSSIWWSGGKYLDRSHEIFILILVLCQFIMAFGVWQNVRRMNDV